MKKNIFKKIRNIHISSRTLFMIIVLAISTVIFVGIQFNIRISAVENIGNRVNDIAAYVKSESYRQQESLELLKVTQEQNTNSLKDRLDVVSFSMFTTFGVVGDSYASGSVAINGELYEHLDVSWGQILARRNGNECVNLSVGGCTTSSWLMHDNERGLKLLKETEPLSLYILALGINDRYLYGMDYLGSLEDIDITNYYNNADSFYGNYARIIEEIKRHSPNAKIIMMTMADNWSEESVAYNKAIVEISKVYGYPCLRIHENEFFISELYKDNLSADHPIAVLYSGMAVAIEEMIEQEMIDNIDYFSDYVG